MAVTLFEQNAMMLSSEILKIMFGLNSHSTGSTCNGLNRNVAKSPLLCVTLKGNTRLFYYHEHYKKQRTIHKGLLTAPILTL